MDNYARIRHHVLNRILSQNNSQLLKKFLLTVHHGWFRVNGQAPDKQFSLADYLLDNGRLMFDYTGLSSEGKKRFEQWFYGCYIHAAQQVYLNEAATNNYRGYTAESTFSWWGRLINLIFYKKKSYKWSLSPFELNLDYQLNDLEITPDKNGLLISLNQFGVKDLDFKYHDINDGETQSLQNTKRVFLNDSVVEKLINLNIEDIEYDVIFASPHPYAVNVLPETMPYRFEAMRDYRRAERFTPTKPWFVRLLFWLKSQFVEAIELVAGYKKPIVHTDNTPEKLIEEENIQVLRRKQTREIIITEKRPDLDCMVFCGGGAKIFSHVGSYQAFEEIGVRPTKFAGSSAGAIIATLCYLGYTSTEIKTFFQQFRKDNLIHYQVDSSGISTTAAMKAALDFMIIQKINQLIKDYKINETYEGQQFLNEKVFCRGKITFDSLNQIKKRYPDCCLGDTLVVTATNINRQKTRYFSNEISPYEEVSQVGSMSASLPIAFKPTLFSDGDMYNDGGILSNLPTEAFHDDHSTLLRSEHGNCLRLIAFQFDNGPEHHILTSLVDRVYRENFLLNWIYSLLTGIKDPASGWERDRLKLLRHSNQVILVSTGDISSAKFDITPAEQEELMAKGYEAAKHYIDARYGRHEGKVNNEEYLYMTFSCIQEAVYYCCHRKRHDWFERIAGQAIKSGDMKESEVNQLRQEHFGKQVKVQPEKNVPLEKQEEIKRMDNSNLMIRIKLFAVLYPLFLKLPLTVVAKEEVKLYRQVRHNLSIHNPISNLEILNNLKGEFHVSLHILIQLMNQYQQASQEHSVEDIERICQQLTRLHSLLPKLDKMASNRVFWGRWALQNLSIDKVLEQIESGEEEGIINYFENLKLVIEPFQPLNSNNNRFFNSEQPLKEGKSHECNAWRFSWGCGGMARP